MKGNESVCVHFWNRQTIKIGSKHCQYRWFLSSKSESQLRWTAFCFFFNRKTFWGSLQIFVSKILPGHMKNIWQGKSLTDWSAKKTGSPIWSSNIIGGCGKQIRNIVCWKIYGHTSNAFVSVKNFTMASSYLYITLWKEGDHFFKKRILPFRSLSRKKLKSNTRPCNFITTRPKKQSIG